MSKQLQIRNSTAEFLIFQAEEIGYGYHMSEIPTHGVNRHVSAEQAKEYAETELEKYRVIQDRLFESDLDRFELPKLPFDEG